jgi:hypothetical protein
MKMNIYYVYQLRLANSETPFYIGKGKGRRANSHLTMSSLATRNHKNHIIKKAMMDGIVVLTEIIHQNLTEPDALAIEASLIAEYGRRNDGGILSNATLGGEGMSGFKASTETKLKMSESAKKVIKTEEWKQKIGMGRRGKPHTEETKNKMREVATGRKHSEETREKISKAGIGRRHSEETLKRMSDAKIGKPKSDETKKRMSEASRGRTHTEETKNKIKKANNGKRHGDDSKAKISLRLTGRKFSEEHKESILFSKWDKNPAWVNADAIHKLWLENGKPHVTKMKRLMSGSSIAQITLKFIEGWNPANDPSWIKYKSRINHVG